MRKLLTLLTFILALSVLSCGGPGTDGGTLTITNTVNVSNFVDVTITNSPDQYIDTALMNAVIGEWLVTLELFTDVSNGLDAESNIIYIQYQNTNTYTSISNGGMDGAYTFKFKPNFYVNKIVYNGQGTVDEYYTNLYIFSILSNVYGYRIDLEAVSQSAESHYLKPSGPFLVLGYSTNEYVVKTNYLYNFTVTNVTTDTNSTSILISHTNDWVFYIDKQKIIDSYSFYYSTNFISGSEWHTNMTLGPDTNYYQLFVDENVKSSRQESVTITYTYNGWGASTSPYINFMLDQNKGYQLQKIKE